MYTVYILRTDRNTLYVGQTNDVDKRLADHRSHTKRSSKYMRSFRSFDLVYKEECETRSRALIREHEIKQMTHAAKEELIVATHLLK